MKAKRIVVVMSALAFPFSVAILANGCGGKETEPPPVSSAPAPTPTPTPTPTVEMVPEEDAGADADAGDADADAPKATGSYDPTGVRACCAALSQNVNSAPLDQKPMYIQAAAICNGLINSPQGRQALIAVRGALRGANVPSSCR